MATLFMTDDVVRNFDDAQRADTDRYGALFRHLLERGIYVAPSQFEAMFVSLAHGDDESTGPGGRCRLPRTADLWETIAADAAGSESALWCGATSREEQEQRAGVLPAR